MEAQLASWLVSLVTGGVCGNIAGTLFKDLNLGPRGNTIAGVVGGVPRPRDTARSSLYSG
jgi:hypothetical protein